MPQITDLNVAPYYDDFDKEDNFHRVLFRPELCNTSKRTNTTTIHHYKTKSKDLVDICSKKEQLLFQGQVTYSNILLQRSTCIYIC